MKLAEHEMLISNLQWRDGGLLNYRPVVEWTIHNFQPEESPIKEKRWVLLGCCCRGEGLYDQFKDLKKLPDAFALPISEKRIIGGDWGNYPNNIVKTPLKSSFLVFRGVDWGIPRCSASDSLCRGVVSFSCEQSSDLLEATEMDGQFYVFYNGLQIPVSHVSMVPVLNNGEGMTIAVGGNYWPGLAASVTATPQATPSQPAFGYMDLRGKLRSEYIHDESWEETNQLDHNGDTVPHYKMKLRLKSGTDVVVEGPNCRELYRKLPGWLKRPMGDGE